MFPTNEFFVQYALWHVSSQLKTNETLLRAQKKIQSHETLLHLVKKIQSKYDNTEK